MGCRRRRSGGCSTGCNAAGWACQTKEKRLSVMSIVKLSLVNIIGDLKCLDDVVIRCMGRGDFHPEKPRAETASTKGFSPLLEQNPYAERLKQMADLGAYAGITPEYLPKYADEARLSKFNMRGEKYSRDFCDEFRRSLDVLRQRRNFLKSELEQAEGALVCLSHLAELEVPFDEIFSCRYVKARFGRMPLDSLQKLALYDDRTFLFCRFDTEKEDCWCAYFALADDAPEIDDLFSALYFERYNLPRFVHGTPEEALLALRETIARNQDELRLVERQADELVSTKKGSFNKLYTQLKFMSDAFSLRRYAAVLHRDFLDVFYMSGFVESAHAKEFAESIQGIEGVTVELKPYDSDKRLKAPTKLQNRWLAQPFEMFVEMYGLPSYNDIDPTPFVAWTYCLLFGIMFGDLGQGLLLVIAGALLWRYKRMNIGRVINRVGIFSCIFGTLYGSVFGFEDLLTPFYTQVLGLPGKPVEVMAPESTSMILLAAVAMGAVLIGVSIAVDIYIGFRKHDLERALFSANGLAGLVFYGAILYGLVSSTLLGKNPFTGLYVLLLILLPLLVIWMKEPLGELVRSKSLAKAKPADGMGNYLMVGFFELFEVVLSFFSNTMSFLRVGGFVLSHAGMMMVVMTLSDMVGAAASPFVIVLGNLFVIGMEGLIVGIQVLRLEFYELFSRYFDGDGRVFAPVSVVPAANGN